MNNMGPAQRSRREMVAVLGAETDAELVEVGPAEATRIVASKGCVCLLAEWWESYPSGSSVQYGQLSWWGAKPPYVPVKIGTGSPRGGTYYTTAAHRAAVKPVWYDGEETPGPGCWPILAEGWEYPILIGSGRAPVVICPAESSYRAAARIFERTWKSAGRALFRARHMGGSA